LEIRCAVTAGDVLLRDGDIFGNAVNLAARLESVTPAGEIHFTEAVFQNLTQQMIASEFVGEMNLMSFDIQIR
jgi:adenylate cyclase